MKSGDILARRYNHLIRLKRQHHVIPLALNVNTAHPENGIAFCWSEPGKITSRNDMDIIQFREEGEVN
jgi:hypothetical protein